MRSRPKVVIHLAGGLGNQMFQYAFGRRLAHVNGVPLVLDKHSGFPNDRFNRTYALGHFNLKCDFLPESASLATTTGKIRRRFMKWRSAGKPLEQKRYIEEEVAKLDPRLLTLRIDKRVFFVGCWQFEDYFKDAEQQVRADFEPIAPHNEANLRAAERIRSCDAICVHVRLLRSAIGSVAANPTAADAQLQVAADYYNAGLAKVLPKASNPKVFIFSDFPEAAKPLFANLPCPHEFVTHNGADAAHEDMWLMSLCRHFVIANSTFSWWGAYLGKNPEKIVVAPKGATDGALVSVPPEWIAL